ncbi:ATP-binding protein [Streptomyces griseoluteus]|uniref:ATP-binding protein n=1 Tax=Streptomyces griseoluteus TaxID=29306 RepID=UPI0037031A82
MKAPSETTDGLPGDAPSPMVASLFLEGDGTRIGLARHFAASFLRTACDTGGILIGLKTVETAQLIVSELVTNAMRHAPGPALLRLSVFDGTLRIEVRDGSPLAPAVRAPDPARVGQHGLEIVTALARSVSVESAGTGKSVTAVVGLT